MINLNFCHVNKLEIVLVSVACQQKFSHVPLTTVMPILLLYSYMVTTCDQEFPLLHDYVSHTDITL